MKTCPAAADDKDILCGLIRGTCDIILDLITIFYLPSEELYQSLPLAL